MIKIRVTEKQLKEGYKNIISIGYCNAYYLLIGQDAQYYTCGVYGWKSDIYHINNNTIISTGYAPIGTLKNYKLINDYEIKASAIYNNDNSNLKYDMKIKIINELLHELVNKLIEEGGQK